jgi:hypothetical protein
VRLERGPLSFVTSFVTIIEELRERKSSGSGLENRQNGRRDPSRLPCGTLYPQMLALTSPTSGGRSVGIVRSRTKVTEFSFSLERITFISCSIYIGVVIVHRWKFRELRSQYMTLNL